MCRTQDRADKQALLDFIFSWGNEEGNALLSEELIDLTVCWENSDSLS